MRNALAVGGQQQNGKILLLIIADVGEQRLKILCQRRQLLGDQGEDLFGRQLVALGDEVVEHDRAARLQKRKECVGFEVVSALAAADDAVFHQLLLLLRGAAGECAHLFANALRVVEEENGVLRQIIECRVRCFGEYRQIAVDRGEADALAELFAVGLDLVDEAFGQLGAVQSAQQIGHTGRKRFAAAVGELRRELTRRRNAQPAEVFGAALGRGIEGADRVDLVAEKFKAHGPRHRRAENVENAAAEGKLPDALYGIGAQVPKPQKRLREHLRGDLVADGKLEDRIGKGVGRERSQRKCFDRTADGGDRPASEPVKHGEAALLPFAADAFNVVEGELACGEHGVVDAAQRRSVGRKGGGSPFVGGQDGDRAVEFGLDRRSHECAVQRRKPADHHGRICGFQFCFQFLPFRGGKYRFAKGKHVRSSCLWSNPGFANNTKRGQTRLALPAGGYWW